MSQPRPAGIPFQIHGVVTREHFTDRAREVERIVRTLQEPAAKLLVYGPRRMGKTSAIAQAMLRHQRKGGKAFLADLSTASSPVDMANRILESAIAALGKDWRDLPTELAGRLGITVSLQADSSTGQILPRLDAGLRSAAPDAQQRSIAGTLDAINENARKRRTAIGIVLDEFQEITRFGGERAEWSLRGTIQHHRHVSYVLSGSESHLLRRMLSKESAFFGMLDQLEFGPIDAEHLAKWVDDRMGTFGVSASGVGKRCAEVAGPRTRDIIQLARQCWIGARAARKATAADVDAALEETVAEQDAPLRTQWSALTAIQQNVLRAVAMNSSGLTTRATREQFGLPSTGTAANTASALIEMGILEKSAATAGYSFDNPFFRRWVERNTLADVGLPQPPRQKTPTA